jgi:hypothetical protein
VRTLYVPAPVLASGAPNSLLIFESDYDAAKCVNASATRAITFAEEPLWFA